MHTANTLVLSQSYSGHASVESALPSVEEDAAYTSAKFTSACAPQATPEDQVTRLTEGSGTSACALKATLLLETPALRKALVNGAFRHDV